MPHNEQQLEAPRNWQRVGQHEIKQESLIPPAFLLHPPRPSAGESCLLESRAARMGECGAGAEECEQTE